MNIILSELRAGFYNLSDDGKEKELMVLIRENLSGR
jgi:hypothetical protein